MATMQQNMRDDWRKTKKRFNYSTFPSTKDEGTETMAASGAEYCEMHFDRQLAQGRSVAYKAAYFLT